MVRCGEAREQLGVGGLRLAEGLPRGLAVRLHRRARVAKRVAHRLERLARGRRHRRRPGPEHARHVVQGVLGGGEEDRRGRLGDVEHVLGDGRRVHHRHRRAHPVLRRAMGARERQLRRLRVRQAEVAHPRLPSRARVIEVAALARAIVPLDQRRARRRGARPRVDARRLVGARLLGGQVAREEGQQEHHEKEPDTALEDRHELALEARRRRESQRARRRAALHQSLAQRGRGADAPVDGGEADDHEHVPQADRRELRHRPEPHHRAVDAVLRRPGRDEQAEDGLGEEPRRARDDVAPQLGEERVHDDGPEEQRDARQAEQDGAGAREVIHGGYRQRRVSDSGAPVTSSRTTDQNSRTRSRTCRRCAPTTL